MYSASIFCSAVRLALQNNVASVGWCRNTINKMKECCRQLPFPSKRSLSYRGLQYPNRTNPMPIPLLLTPSQTNLHSNALTFENLMNTSRLSLKENPSLQDTYLRFTSWVYRIMKTWIKRNLCNYTENYSIIFFLFAKEILILINCNFFHLFFNYKKLSRYYT